MAIKPKQPVLTRKQVEDLIAPYLKELPVEKYPMVAFGIRGLYGPNKRGTWDDGNGFIERTPNGVYAIFPGNCDPTAPYRKGLGSLSSGQILWFKIGLHKGRKAFRQAATFLVDRDGVGKRLKALISCAFNWHDSKTGGTSSLGCQTNPGDVFPAVRELGYMLVRKYYPKTETFPYILVDALEVKEAKETLRANMQVSEAGLSVIKSFEGCYLKAYKDPVGIPTIGWGTIQYPTGVKVKMGDTCTQAEADFWLKHEVNTKALAVGEMLKARTVTQGMYDALVSFAYNVGTGALKSSTLLKKLNAGAPKEEVAAELLRWNKAGGKVLRGLTRRREAEKKLFLA